MSTENFATKYFSETINIGGADDASVNYSYLSSAFKDLASRELSTYTESGRHHKSIELVIKLVNTPRRYHRFKNSLGRRIPTLLEEVDDYDLMLISALEACDSPIFRILIENGREVFENNKTLDKVTEKIGKLEKLEQEAYNVLVPGDRNKDLEKYTRAAAKEHWRAAFFGMGPFVRISKWVELLSAPDEDSVIQSVKLLLEEIEDSKTERYEIVTDVLRTIFQKFDPKKDLTVISKIIEELNRVSIGNLVTPTLATVVQRKLAVIDPDLRFELLLKYLSINADISFPARLYFYLVESPERGDIGKPFSDEQIGEVAAVLVKNFNSERLDFSENCLHYLYRVKRASERLGLKDPVIEALMSRLTNADMMDVFVNTLLSARHPWQSKFSDNGIDLIAKLFGIENFKAVASAYDGTNKITTTVLNDFLEKHSQVKSDDRELAALID